MKEIQEKRGTNEAVMALNNAAGLKTIDDIYNNMATRFFGSVITGGEKGWNNFKRQLVLFNAWKDRRQLTQDEQDALQALDKDMESLPEYSYAGASSALGGMVGSALESLPLMASGVGAKAAVGAGVLALTKNPTAAKWAGDIMASAIMGLEIGAGQYEKNLTKLDKTASPCIPQKLPPTLPSCRAYPRAHWNRSP